MKGYKTFDKYLQWQGEQYEVGREYKRAETMLFRKQLRDVFSDSFFARDKTRVCEVDVLGDVMMDKSGIYTNRFRIVREIPWSEILDGMNQGNGNTGCDNDGNWNSGSRNTGNFNSGSDNDGSNNSGSDNVGYGNSGRHNTGRRNSGEHNSGNENTGDFNNGNENTGDFNNGSWNSSSHNTGHRNSGKFNTGDYNSGDFNNGNNNSGNNNSGNRNTSSFNNGNNNSGNENTGDFNSGNFNSGNGNSGDWNATDFSSGVLCTETPECLIFDKPGGMTLEEWRTSPAAKLLSSVHDSECAQGDFAEWWFLLDDSDKAVIFAIPNFDPDKFEKITGLHLHDEMPKRRPRRKDALEEEEEMLVCLLKRFDRDVVDRVVSRLP